jgi:hypothetical protein
VKCPRVVVEVAAITVTNLHWFYFVCMQHYQHAIFSVGMIALVDLKIEEDYFWVLRASPPD